MDTRKIADLLRATIDPNQQQQAEEQLTQVKTRGSVRPLLLLRNYFLSSNADLNQTMLHLASIGPQDHWICSIPPSSCNVG